MRFLNKNKMKIDLSKAVRGDEFDLRNGNVAIFEDKHGNFEYPYKFIIDNLTYFYREDGTYMNEADHVLDIVKASTIPEQEVDPVQEVLDMIITTIEEYSKSSKVLFDLVKLNTSRIDSVENKIDILMGERKTPEVSEGIDLSLAVKADKFLTGCGNIATYDGGYPHEIYTHMLNINDYTHTYTNEGKHNASAESTLDLVKALPKESIVDCIDLSKAVEYDKFITRRGDVATYVNNEGHDPEYPNSLIIDSKVFTFKDNGRLYKEDEDSCDIVKALPKESIEDNVCSKIQERKALGLDKYGTTMERTDLSIDEWLTHAQEESMDFSIYLEKIIAIRKADKK